MARPANRPNDQLFLLFTPGFFDFEPEQISDGGNNKNNEETGHGADYTGVIVFGEI